MIIKFAVNLKTVNVGSDIVCGDAEGSCFLHGYSNLIVIDSKDSFV